MLLKKGTQFTNPEIKREAISGFPEIKGAQFTIPEVKGNTVYDFGNKRGRNL